RNEVVSNLRSDTALSDEVRPVALELAQEWEEDPFEIVRAAAKLNTSPDSKPEDFARALRGFEFGCRAVPGHGGFLNGLGAGQYPKGKYREAIAPRKTAEPLMKGQGMTPAGANPANLAYQAMAHFRLRQTEEARRLLGRLRQVMKHPLVAGEEN